MSIQNDFSTFMKEAVRFKTIPIIESFSVDTLTPIQMVEKLKDDIVYLLESKDESSSWSRYSFIGLDPFLTIKEENGEFHAADSEMKKLYTASELKKVLVWMSDTCVIKAPELDIPFSGGAVGYLSYDVMSLIEPAIAGHQRVTDMEKCQLFVCRTMIAYDHELKKLHFIHYVTLNGEESENEKAEAYHAAKKDLKELIRRLKDRKSSKELFLPQERHGAPSFEQVRSTYKKEQFMRDVERLKEYIKAGDIFQGVLSQRFDIPVKVGSFELYRVLRLINPSPYMYYMKLPDRELVGSSPERLIHVQNGHLEIHPIAGTRKRGLDQAEDERLEQELLADEKEKAEHYMLVDLARNDIGRVAEYGSVNVPEFTKIVSFSHVMHIISVVTGTLKSGVHPVDALMSAFPAGTLTGAPKIRAMQLLNEIEPEPRETYGGCIAYIGFDGNIDSCITIRTMSVKAGVASIQAGAGIVADSVPEMEWEETCNKAGALLKTIQIAEDVFCEKEEDGHERTAEIVR
ncbi:anthranilate synthase component I [Bacillus glycinifermentans]|uniref:anthranilate synthase component I n=1 Tax=Bacillus glycinifermentans TaxID=1664069 RepID=UPI00065407B1|nr:anthranilate synthase component I [Bacillus glycinifermentans]KMM61397.1 anthranilate synthase component I [Bacillus glycinifermentans]MEC0494663.1 anthranilate synthase component I [Bacillus glycinifermentans]MEC0541193.1 anthranilate synthase component I [Bacillus glycinifermentans]